MAKTKSSTNRKTGTKFRFLGIELFFEFNELCFNRERDSSPDLNFFFSGTEKEKYKGQGMKSLAGFGTESHKKTIKLSL